MPDVTIRQLTEGDAPAYRALRLHLLQVSPESYGTTYEEAAARPLAQTVERLRAQQDPAVGFTLGAFVAGAAGAGELVGMATLLRQDGAKSSHRAEVVAVGVAAAARGQGIGRALMLALLDRARRCDGLEQLLLAVTTTNAAALGLYRALGFVPYGLDRRALKLGDRYWDEELLALAL